MISTVFTRIFSLSLFPHSLAVHHFHSYEDTLEWVNPWIVSKDAIKKMGQSSSLMYPEIYNLYLKISDFLKINSQCL